MVEQPVDGLVLIEHQHELHDERQIQRLEHFTCMETETPELRDNQLPLKTTKLLNTFAAEM